MNQQKEWAKIQESYDSVRFNQIQKNTKQILEYIKTSKPLLKKYVDNTTILARPLNEGEVIFLTEKTQKTAKKNQWLIQTSDHKQKILEDVEFEYYYNKEIPVKGSGSIKMYKPNNRTFVGLVYEGSPISLRTSNKGITKAFSKQVIGFFEEDELQNIELYDSDEFNKRFSLID